MICNQEINTSLSAVNVHFVITVTTLSWCRDVLLNCIILTPPPTSKEC